MSDSDETERFEARVSSELVEAAGPWAYGEKKQLIEDALKRKAFGDEVAETEEDVERTREQLEGEITAFKRIEQSFSNVPSLASVEERIREARIERTHEVARANRDRLTTNEERITEQEADSETASPGAKMSPVEAVEAIVSDDGYGNSSVSDRVLKEGPDNLAVQTHAEKCGMNPDEFFEFMLTELDDSQLVVEHELGKRYDKQESVVATDGGDSP